MPRPKPATPLLKLTIHVPEDVGDALRRAANVERVTVSRFVVAAVRASLERRLQRAIDDGANGGL